MRESEILGGAARAEVERLLEGVKAAESLGERMDLISARFVGRPYLIDPLGGGPGSPETLKAGLEGFDCVTYIETVLALALSDNSRDFVRVLRNMRYAGGEVDWAGRNHYMTDWAERNEERGLVINLTRGPDAVTKTRTLAVVEGLPAKSASFPVFPKRRLNRVEGIIQTGDLILFASTRRDLDVFHTGIIIRNKGGTLLRHATRGQGRVVEQPLRDFLAAHRMSGFILLRPSGINEQ